MFHSTRAKAKLQELLIGRLSGPHSSSQFLQVPTRGSRLTRSVGPASGTGPYGLYSTASVETVPIPGGAVRSPTQRPISRAVSVGRDVSASDNRAPLQPLHQSFSMPVVPLVRLTRSNTGPTHLNPDEFVELQLKFVTALPDGQCWLFRVRLPPGGTARLLKACEHVRVRCNGQMRSYTPLCWGSDYFDLLIKRYAEPEVSAHRE
jgi:hypothetical protein